MVDKEVKMWDEAWRQNTWSSIDKPWDIIIVGGGITGAGILRESTRLGLQVLLVEQSDFGWGTSSRSSKLVHGGFRYLKEGKLTLTRNSVREREQLLQDGPGLIDPLGFLLTVHKGDFPGRWTYEVGLSVYDLLALRWDHNYYSPEDFQLLAPHISLEDLQGGFRFGDAQTDDARLTLRVIREACADGGTAINYVRAVGLVMENGRVNGVCLKDILTDQEAVARAQVVINATGAWADQLRKQVGGPAHIRPLRGSHLIFPAWRLPVAQAVSFMHPLDHRPVFIFPWEGITLVGTTDVDHPDPLEEEPKISPEEVSYLMAAVEYQFPSLGISLQDVISTYSGVRPVIGSGKLNPSEESRDHVIWEENGLITVTGGKLTTFRLIGLDVINAIRELIPGIPERHDGIPVLNPVDVRLPGCDDLNDTCRRRLLGRLGADALPMLRSARADEMEVIAGTNYRWAELRWAARSEGVCHLDDLLLRRTRLGLILPQGAQSILPRLKQICIEELAWSEPRWQEEQKRYLELWLKNYALPHPELIPDWRIAVKNTMRVREIHAQKQRKKMIRSSGLAALSFVMIGMSLAQLWKRSRRSKT